MVKKINNKPMIQIVLERLSKARLVDKIILATTSNKLDDKLDKIAKILDEVFEVAKDVLKDAMNALLLTSIITRYGDCPLLDLRW